MLSYATYATYCMRVHCIKSNFNVLFCSDSDISDWSEGDSESESDFSDLDLQIGAGEPEFEQGKEQRNPCLHTK